MPTTAQRLARHARQRRASSGPIPPTDGELLMRFRQSGDQQALAEVLDRHAGLVWGVCRNVLHRPQDAEDAFQAAFLILLRRSETIRSSDSAAGWLYRVALRTACDVRRNRLRRREEPLELEPAAPEPAFPDIQRRQQAMVLMEELRTLPEKLQAPLVMRYLQGLSRQEIADQLDTTVPGVQGRLARGKRQLRSRLMRRGVSLSAAMAVVTAGRPAEAAPVGPVLGSGGAIASHAAIVQQLTLSGARSMMIAAYAKPLALAATIAIAALVATADDQSSLASTPASDPVVQLDATPVEADASTPTAVAVSVAQPPNEKASEGGEQPIFAAAPAFDREATIDGLMRDPYGPKFLREEAEWFLDNGLGDPEAPQAKLLKKWGSSGREDDFLRLFTSERHRQEPGMERRFQLVAAQMEGTTAPDDPNAPQLELVKRLRRRLELAREQSRHGELSSSELAATESRYALAIAELLQLRGESDRAKQHFQNAIEMAQKQARYLQMATDAGEPPNPQRLVEAAEQIAAAKRALLDAQREAPRLAQQAGGSSSPPQPAAAPAAPSLPQLPSIMDVHFDDTALRLQADQLRLEHEHWQLKAKALEMQSKAIKAPADLDQKQAQEMQAKAMLMQAEARKAQAMALNMEQKMMELQAKGDKLRRTDSELDAWMLRERALKLQAEVALAKALQAESTGEAHGVEVQELRANAMLLQADAEQAQVNVAELQQRMKELQERATPRYSAPVAPPGLVPRAPPILTQPAPPVAPQPGNYSMPLPAPAYGVGRVQPGDQLVLTIRRQIRDSDGTKDVFESQGSLVDPNGQLHYTPRVEGGGPAATVLIDVSGRTLAEVKQALNTHDAGVTGVSLIARSAEQGVGRPLVMASPAPTDQLDAMRKRLEEQGKLIEQLQSRLQQVDPLEVVDQEKESADALPRQGNWRTFHKPSTLDPKGWAVIADLSVGQRAPAIAGLPDPRPYLVCVGSDRPNDPNYVALSVLDFGHANNVAGVLPGNRFTKVRDQLINVRRLGPGRAEGAHLLLIRGVQGRSPEEMAENLPDRETALAVLYDKPTGSAAAARGELQLADTQKQLAEMRQALERARQDAEKQRQIAMESRQMESVQRARLEEQLRVARDRLKQAGEAAARSRPEE